MYEVSLKDFESTISSTSLKAPWWSRFALGETAQEPVEVHFPQAARKEVAPPLSFNQEFI